MSNAHVIDEAALTAIGIVYWDIVDSQAFVDPENAESAWTWWMQRRLMANCDGGVPKGGLGVIGDEDDDADDAFVLLLFLGTLIPHLRRGEADSTASTLEEAAKTIGRELDLRERDLERLMQLAAPRLREVLQQLRTGSIGPAPSFSSKPFMALAGESIASKVAVLEQSYSELVGGGRRIPMDADPFDTARHGDGWRNANIIDKVYREVIVIRDGSTTRHPYVPASLACPASVHTAWKKLGVGGGSADAIASRVFLERDRLHCCNASWVDVQFGQRRRGSSQQKAAAARFRDWAWVLNAILHWASPGAIMVVTHGSVEQTKYAVQSAEFSTGIVCAFRTAPRRRGRRVSP